MIDIHSHILPDVDDGATDITEALKMARFSANDGVKIMFATPHQKFYRLMPREEVANRVATLQKEIDSAKIPLTLIAGYETELYDGLFEEWAKGMAGPLGNSRYVLTEPPLFQLNDYAMKLLFEYFERGYIPILAHPERYSAVREDLSILDPFLAKGGLTQITAVSLTTNKNSSTYKTAVELLRQGMAHIIASDSHNTYRRPPGLAAARNVAAEIVGPTKADAMVNSTPLAIVEDREIVF